MERLTTDKPVSEMGIVDLAYNSCFAKDGEAFYRDFEKEMSARDFIRMLYKKHLEIEIPEGIDAFDDYIKTDLEFGAEYDVDGVIALLYHMLWSKADLYERLKKYEDAEEQGLLLRLPCKVGDTVYILAGRFGTFYEEDICDGFYIGRDGILQVKVQNHKGNHGTYGVVGKTVFLTKEEAEAALADMKEKEK